MLMLSNAKKMLDKYQKHTDHYLGIHLQYADHSQWMHRATLPIGVSKGGEKKKRKAVPRAAVA